MLPLCEFDGWLKQIRADDLSAVERLALDCVFPSLAPPNAGAIEAAARHLRTTNEGYASTHTIERMMLSVRVNKRRFAGDHTLGPRNYHTVALNAAGEDGSTLIAELAAYSDDSVGACSVHDGATVDLARELGIEHRRHCVLLQFHGTPGSHAAMARVKTKAVWIPYRVERARIEGVIDLRYIGQWMRMYGVNALVYPSARLPVGVVWDGDAMTRWTGWNLVDYRGHDRQVFEATTLILGTDPWQSPHADRFELQRRGASWVMVPPKMTFRSCRPIADDDLRMRFAAGEAIFGGLIGLAVQHRNTTEESWLESLRTACETRLGKQILDYMGIRNVRTLEADDGSMTAVLFECWRFDVDATSISKGFACINEGSASLDASLDGLVGELASGVPRFAAIRDGMHVYVLRETG